MPCSTLDTGGRAGKRIASASCAALLPSLALRVPAPLSPYNQHKQISLPDSETVKPPGKNEAAFPWVHRKVLQHKNNNGKILICNEFHEQ